ncbi:MAG TPA: DNA gyrase inhibitor YacG [Bauldia sp.]|nr:DNA gyrase inhibitor YacG [Bauldia sp.]
MTRAKAEGAAVVPLYRPRKCPICGKPSVREFHPFSSKRCADLDLGKWLTGGYAIAAAETEPQAQAEGEDGEE